MQVLAARASAQRCGAGGETDFRDCGALHGFVGDGDEVKPNVTGELLGRVQDGLAAGFDEGGDGAGPSGVEGDVGDRFLDFVLGEPVGDSHRDVRFELFDVPCGDEAADGDQASVAA